MPLRVNMAGVIPIIFAAACWPSRRRSAQFFPHDAGVHQPALRSRRRWAYIARSRASLIIVFTYFYTAVQFNPVDQADNLRKHGGYIPGIRPGPPTAQYLDRVLTPADAARLDLSGGRRRPAEHLHQATAASRRQPRAPSAAPRC